MVVLVMVYRTLLECHGLSLKSLSSECIVLLGDGECNEGSVWEAVMSSSAQNLNDALVDFNGFKVMAQP